MKKAVLLLLWVCAWSCFGGMVEMTRVQGNEVTIRDGARTTATLRNENPDIGEGNLFSRISDSSVIGSRIIQKPGNNWWMIELVKLASGDAPEPFDPLSLAPLQWLYFTNGIPTDCTTNAIDAQYVNSP